MNFGVAEAISAPNPEPAVIPAVQQWTGGEGGIPLKNCSIVVDEKSKLLPVARIFQQDLKSLGFPDVPITAGFHGASGTQFVLTLGAMPAIPKPGISDQAYTIDLGSAIQIHGQDAVGVFYGTRTLLQMIEQNLTARSLPQGRIVDYPVTRQRMLMLDVARKVYPYEILLDYLRMMAWCKMNELHLHLSDEVDGGLGQFRIECSTYPGLTSKEFYTKKQLRALQDVAHSYGITITPEIDMPGHARVFTTYWPELRNPKLNNSELDVTNPLTVQRMERLLDEMIPIFDAPDFHIGTDEYSIGGSVEDKEKFGEAFRVFINTMNAYIRTKGKNCRIWSGYEGMSGKTEVDPSVVIDMWETDSARKLIDEGHKVINSNQSWTYIVPGGHYYGVSIPGTYNGWEPCKVSGDAARNPAPDDPHFLGAKLHVWGDYGPTGYDLTEIADLTYPTMLAFSEKMWGRKGSQNYSEFQKRSALVDTVPGVSVFDRIPSPNREGIMLAVPAEHVLDPHSSLPLAYAGRKRTDLEYPWTLTMKVFPCGNTSDRGVILSSDSMEICANYSREEDQKTKDPTTGVETKQRVTRCGVGLVRAAGQPGEDPSRARYAGDVSRVYSDPLPVNQWTTISVVGAKGMTSVYVNGKLSGEHNDQMLCPLIYLGSKTGHSFTGKVKDLLVYNRALSASEIGRMAGLDIPENLAAGCAVTASASDTSYDLTPEKVTDDDPHTRWSSAPTGADQWLDIDLGAVKSFNEVTIKWQEAYATEYRIAVSSDGHAWKEVFAGTGHEGLTEASFADVSGRHLRILMTKPANQWGYSIYQVEAFLRKGGFTAQ